MTLVLFAVVVAVSETESKLGNDMQKRSFFQRPSKSVQVINSMYLTTGASLESSFAPQEYNRSETIPKFYTAHSSTQLEQGR